MGLNESLREEQGREPRKKIPSTGEGEGAAMCWEENRENEVLEAGKDSVQ